MREGLAAVAMVCVLLSGAPAAHAECSRGANCLGRWRRGHQPSPEPVEPVPAAERPVLPLPTAEPEVLALPAPAPALSRFPTGHRHWYGWQLLVVDGAVLAGLGIATAARVRGDGATVVGFSLGLVFDVVPPIIHGVHHRGGIGWASFGVRATLPAAVAITTLLLSSCRGRNGSPFDNVCLNSTAGNVSALLGLAAASALDASLFAWDAPARVTPSRATLQWTPVLTPRTDGVTLGAIGFF